MVDPHLAPADAAVAVRSLPRRFREAFAPRPDDVADPAELAQRHGPGGTSASLHLAAAEGLVQLLGSALEQVSAGRDPVVPRALVDPAERAWPEPAMSLEVLLDRLTETASAAAERIDRLSSGDWGTELRIAGSSPVTAVDALRTVVADAVGELRAAERALDAVRSG